MATPLELNNAIDRFISSEEKQFNIVQGPIGTTVTTNAGSVPSYLEHQYQLGLLFTQSLATRETAWDNALVVKQNAWDASLTSKESDWDNSAILANVTGLVTQAETAKTGAETAETQAEDFRDAAETFKNDAEAAVSSKASLAGDTFTGPVDFDDVVTAGYQDLTNPEALANISQIKRQIAIDRGCIVATDSYLTGTSLESLTNVMSLAPFTSANVESVSQSGIPVSLFTGTVRLSNSGTGNANHVSTVIGKISDYSDATPLLNLGNNGTSYPLNYLTKLEFGMQVEVGITDYSTLGTKAITFGITEVYPTVGNVYAGTNDDSFMVYRIIGTSDYLQAQTDLGFVDTGVNIKSIIDNGGASITLKMLVQGTGNGLTRTRLYIDDVMAIDQTNTEALAKYPILEMSKGATPGSSSSSSFLSKIHFANNIN